MLSPDAAVVGCGRAGRRNRDVVRTYGPTTPRVSVEDWRAVVLISAAGLRAEVWGFSRAVQADVEALVELGVPASVIESPISDAKLQALGVSHEKMLVRILSAVS